MRRAAFIALALWLAGFAHGLHAQEDPAITAQRAAQDLRAASRALDAADGAQDRIAALTETIRAYEEGLVALRKSLRQAAIRESSLRLVFEARREQLSRLLGALLAMQESPAPLLMLHPSGAVGTARSAMILSAVTPALRERTRTLRAELEEIALLRALRENAAVTLEEGLAGVQRARTELARALSDRTDLPRRFTADPEAMRALINGSETLEAFATGLAAMPGGGPGPETPRFKDGRGALPLPVSGTLLHGYKEADAAGISRPGWLLAVRPLSIVTSPWPATIRYRGPLLDYGNVVILEPDEDFLLVLAGLGAVYGEVGEIVPEGAPLGLMGAATAPDDGVLTGQGVIDAGSERSETLYMELRDRQGPVDPARWFALEED